MQENEVVYGGGRVTEYGLRRMSRWGAAVGAAWALVLITWAVLWPDPYRMGWRPVVELLVVGRTVCAYNGIHLGFSNLYLFLQGGLQDIGMFLLIFPLFVRFYEKVARGRWFDRLFGSLTRAAERHQERIQGWGALGLFLFVFFPVSGTGTLIGCVVGYLLGFQMRYAVPIVVAAHLSSLVILLGFFDWLEPILRSMDEGFATYFAWILLAVILLAGWLYGVVRNRMAAWRANPVRMAPLRKEEAGAEAE